MIKVEKAKLEGVLLIQPEVFRDHRGCYVETYNEKGYFKAGVDIKFVQDDYSCSSKNVLRGLHGDSKTWKLVSCPIGELMLAVVNWNEGSAQFKDWEIFTLSEDNCQQVLVPPNFANGHLILSERAVFSYKQSTYYDPDTQFTVKWNDPVIGIPWPIKEPILSKRDESDGHVK